MDKDNAQKELFDFLQEENDKIKDDFNNYINDNTKIANEKSLLLYKPTDADIQLNAYLASALTGLKEIERDLIFSLSDIISELCISHNIILYEPRKTTDPIHHSEIEDTKVFEIDRKKVLESDLIIHLTHFASTGAGEELEFAHSILLPTILISKDSSHISKMVTGIPNFKVHIRYNDPEMLRSELNDTLTRIKPLLIERKLAFSNYDKNIVGDRIREIREQQELTRKQVADAIPGLTELNLKTIEESTDRISNPSLAILRQIASILHTTVAEIVEPDMQNYIISYLHDWIDNPNDGKKYSARGQTDSFQKRDRNKIIRRILLRIIDSLEKND